MLQNQRACQLVRSKTGCEPLAFAVAWGARTAGRCAAGVLGTVKHQRFSDQQLETFAARAPGICPKPVCDAGEPCPLPPQDDAVDVSVIVPVHNGERFLHACLDSILHQNTTRRLQVLAVEDGSTDGSGAILAEYARQKKACTLVKGLRAVSDYENELQMALINRKLNPRLETMFLPSSAKYTYVSSSVVKEMARYGADLSDFVPREIIDDVNAKMKSRRDG